MHSITLLSWMFGFGVDRSGSPSLIHAGLRLVDLVTGTIIFTTDSLTEVQTFLVPAKYLGPNATVQTQLLIITDPAGATDQILNGATVLAHGTAIGTINGITQPVVTAYTVKQVA